MKPTLYEALGLSRTASESEVKTALRRLVRRYYAKMRAGNADVEEALRFLNHASHILGDPARRAEYDAELAENARVASSLTTVGPLKNDAAPGAKAEADSGDSIPVLELVRGKSPPAIEQAPGWIVQLADLRRTRAGQLSALLIVLLIFLLVWRYVLPADSTAILKFGLAMLGGLLAAAGVAFAVVNVLSRTIWRPPVPEDVNTLVEGMIPRWRRDRTVFMGTGVAVEDATWLFRLRMAELRRVSAERVSDPQPAMRLLARLFDYALWGMAVMGILSLLVWVGVMPVALNRTLSHPLLAPIWISASWIPVEAFLLARAQTTAGRWLLCVYLHYQVSNSYAPEELRFTYGSALRRAADVWWRGCGAWLPVVALVAMARAREHVSRSGETRWDSERDCLVTHGPVGYLGLVTLTLGLAASLLVMATTWKEPVREMSERWRHGWSAITERYASAQTPADAPTPPAPRARISRIDDLSPPAATVEPVVDAPDSSRVPRKADSEPAASPATPTIPIPTVASPGHLASPAASNKRRPVVPPVAIRPAATPPAATPPAATPPAVTPPVATLPAATPPVAPPLMAPPLMAPPPMAPPPVATPPVATPPVATPPVATPPVATAPVASADVPVLSPIEKRNRRVAAYKRRAQQQQAAGDFAGLAKTCQRWADDDWRNPRAYYCAGLGLQGIGRHKQAIAQFNKAGALLPRNDPLKTLIGDAVLRSFRAQAGR